MVVSKKSVPLVPQAEVPPPPRHDRWWFRDVVIPLLIAVIVGGMTIWGQARVDDSRSDREQAASESLSQELVRLEDLRFIRERSAGIEPIRGDNGLVTYAPLPFSGMDLQGMNLSFMDLRGADFTSANLSGVSFFRSRLNGATFHNTTLDNTSFVEAELHEAYFYRVSLRGVDFSNSTGGIFTDVCWDEATKQPPNRDQVPVPSICPDPLPPADPTQAPDAGRPTAG